MFLSPLKLRTKGLPINEKLFSKLANYGEPSRPASYNGGKLRFHLSDRTLNISERIVLD